MKAALIDSKGIVIRPDDNPNQIDVTEIIQQGYYEVLPGTAYDNTNDKYWTHSKLFNKYVTVDNGRYLVSTEWFNSVQYFKQSQNYETYLRYIRRNAKNHQTKRNGLYTLNKSLFCPEVI